MKGIVNWYNEQKGYGFVCGEDGNDVFVYRKAIDFLTLLNAGDAVEYDVQNAEQGFNAFNVKKL
ncbi:MAG: cold shock domain-containing protein [Euryarchaeota archaeon]|nr:cold shock domain-containing protein [Euryarchaeota archaeon]